METAGSREQKSAESTSGDLVYFSPGICESRQGGKVKEVVVMMSTAMFLLFSTASI